MIEIIAFVLVLGVSIRTVGYGIWTIKGKNITGGVFIILLAAATLGLGASQLLIPGA